MTIDKISEFEKTIAYSFKDRELLRLAFTHSSFANEKRRGCHENNERLEFLGDAVLDMVVSEYMYRQYPQMPEGELTKLRAGVVCESSLAKLAIRMDFGQHLFLGKGEESTGGRSRDSILADSFEAVIGAVLIDGGFEAVSSYILRFMAEEINRAQKNFKTRDSKTSLQEIIQKNSKLSITYTIVSETGPDHDKIFTANVCHGEKILGIGKGKSKKEAEQCAANNALAKMNK